MIWEKKHYFSNNQLWWKDIEIFKGWLMWQIFSSFFKNPKKKGIYCMGKQKVHISWENKLKRWWKMKNSQFRISNGLFWHNPRVNQERWQKPKSKKMTKEYWHCDYLHVNILLIGYFNSAICKLKLWMASEFTSL